MPLAFQMLSAYYHGTMLNLEKLVGTTFQDLASIPTGNIAPLLWERRELIEVSYRLA